MLFIHKISPILFAFVYKVTANSIYLSIYAWSKKISIHCIEIPNSYIHYAIT